MPWYSEQDATSSDVQALEHVRALDAACGDPAAK
jgi:hypothetical protein